MTFPTTLATIHSLSFHAQIVTFQEEKNTYRVLVKRSLLYSKVNGSSTRSRLQKKSHLSKTTVKRNNRTEGEWFCFDSCGFGGYSRKGCQQCNKAGTASAAVNLWRQETANFRGSVQGVIIRWPMQRNAFTFSSFHHCGVKSNLHCLEFFKSDERRPVFSTDLETFPRFFFFCKRIF